MQSWAAVIVTKMQDERAVSLSKASSLGYPCTLMNNTCRFWILEDDHKTRHQGDLDRLQRKIMQFLIRVIVAVLRTMIQHSRWSKWPRYP